VIEATGPYGRRPRAGRNRAGHNQTIVWNDGSCTTRMRFSLVVVRRAASAQIAARVVECGPRALSRVD
jgi:hypothetical protein